MESLLPFNVEVSWPEWDGGEVASQETHEPIGPAAAMLAWLGRAIARMKEGPACSVS